MNPQPKPLPRAPKPRKPIARYTRVTPFRVKARRSTRVRDALYLAWVRTLPCAAAVFPGHKCEGPIEADHAGKRGKGQKADDTTAIPLCQLAHRQRHAAAGEFRHLGYGYMRAWLDDRIAETQAWWRLRQRNHAAMLAGEQPPASGYDLVLSDDVIQPIGETP